GVRAPGRKSGIGQHVSASARFAGSNGGTGGTTPAFVVGPGNLESIEIAFVETGMGNGTDAPGLVLFGKAEPRHRVTAVCDQIPANRFEIFGFRIGASHRLAALLERLQGAV